MSVAPNFSGFARILSLFSLLALLALTACNRAVSDPLPEAHLQSTPVAPSLVQPFLYTAKSGDGSASLAHKFLAHTSYMTTEELEAALREANHKTKFAGVKPGEQIVVPGYEAGPIVEHSVAVPKTFESRTIYLTGLMAGSDHGVRLIRRWHELGGNAVVFDIKDSDGIVNIAFDDPLAPKTHHPYIANLPKLVRFLHSLNMHAIARIALFRDQHIAVEHPALAVQSKRALLAAKSNAPQPWRENGKQVWTDPSNSAVQNYDLALAKAAAASGVDEIEFDYVRFPAEGDQADAQFAFVRQHPEWKRADVIADFLARAYADLHPSGVLLSLDVFGVMAWQRPVDLAHTGQDIVRMARSCDVLSPMIYPSHFFGMDGYALPGDAPEHFISTSMQRFAAITRDSGVVIRPWLQAFAWRTKTYSPQYIETQVHTAKINGGIGFLFWNARNEYGRPFTAMPLMQAKSADYFQLVRPAKPPVPSTTPSTAATTSPSGSPASAARPTTAN